MDYTDVVIFPIIVLARSLKDVAGHFELAEPAAVPTRVLRAFE